MGRKSIPVEIRRNIIYKSGGRCQSCNTNLSINGLTQLESNEQEFAHIIAASKDGPRGDEILSKELECAEKNIILLCPSCHKFYDDKRYLDYENVYYLPFHEPDAIMQMKAEQELNVQMLLDTLNKPKTHIVKYTARINVDPIPPSDFLELKRALVIDKLFPAADIIDLSHRNIYGDNETNYWNEEVRQLEGAFIQKLKQRIDNGEINQLGVFAIAPMPLLIKLGTLIRDYAKTVVYQKKKEPTDWIWESEPNEYFYEIIEPETDNDIIAINLSLSDDIVNERIYRILGNDISIWKVTHLNPNNDFIRSKKQLEALRITFRELYRRVSKKHGNLKVIHVFPTMPVSASVEFGRVRNSKADNPLKIYDENKANGGRFEFALDIQ